MATSGVRLNEVLVAISMATDLGLGQPSEHMVRAARLSMRLGDRLGLDSSQLAVLYDVSLLTYVGCPVYGNEAALVFGDSFDADVLGDDGAVRDAIQRGRQSSLAAAAELAAALLAPASGARRRPV